MTPVYDDGSEVQILTEEEDCPTGDDYVDSHDIVPTDEEMAAGRFLGEAIDIDDDKDNGEQWGSVEVPTMTADDFRRLGST